MGINDLQEALQLLAANADRGFFAGPRDPALVEAAEHALGGRLPPTYREFVATFGAGNFGAFEVYGIVDADFDNSSVPNGVWLTLNERNENGLPRELIVIGSTGDGDYYCIDQRSEQEGPVVIYQAGVSPELQHKEKVAHDFGEFLLNGVRNEI